MNRKRVLVLEDDEALSTTLTDHLRREGYHAEVAADGLTGLDKINSGSFDLIISNIFLPGKSGLHLCIAVRREGIRTPILFLAATAEPADRILALKIGGDVCLSKPIDSRELLARAEALMRWPRIRHGIGTREFVEFGSFRMNLRKNQVLKNGSAINLTSKEFQLLRYLAEHPGVPISRDALLASVWDLPPGIVTRTVDMHVCSLRQKLESDPRNPQIIQTVPRGYRFEVHAKSTDGISEDEPDKRIESGGMKRNEPAKLFGS